MIILNNSGIKKFVCLLFFGIGAFLPSTSSEAGVDFDKLKRAVKGERSKKAKKVNPKVIKKENQKQNTKQDVSPPLFKTKPKGTGVHKTVRLTTGKLEKYLTLMGTVELDPDYASHLNPRYPGIVNSIKASVGDKVSIGESLATIVSNVGPVSYTHLTLPTIYSV